MSTNISLLRMYVSAAVARNRSRTLAMLLGTTLAISLLSSVLFYVDASAAQMTQTAISTVPADMQVVAANTQVDLNAVEPLLLAQPGVKGGARFSLAPFSSSQLASSNRATATTPGALMAVDGDYFKVFSRPKIAEGQLTAGSVLISKDLATNLGARPGDKVTFSFDNGVDPLSTTVSGIVDLSGADLLFDPTDPQRRPLAFNPPANVAVMDLATFNQVLRDALLAASTSANANTVVTQATPPVSEQLHLSIDRVALSGDPLQAQADTEQLRRVLERQAPGQIQVINNLSDAIESVKSDVLWAKILVVFLAGPGILLAAYLSRYATTRLITVQGRELALLRARGATPTQVVAILIGISSVVAVIGVLLGLGIGWLTSSSVSGNAGDVSHATLSSVLLSLVIGLAVAIVATAIPARSLYLDEVQTGRRQLGAEQFRPLWQRFYADVAALVIGLVIFVITERNGFAPVLNGEGNATLSLSLLTFLSPTLIWLGLSLLLTRLSARLIRGGTNLLALVLRALFGPTGTLAAQGIARRFGPLRAITMIIALAVAFGVSVSGFAATYRQQQRIDSQLTLGADVRVTPDKANPQTAAFAEQLRALPGVTAVSPFHQTVGYVGSELQDLFAIEAASLRQATTVADSFFLDGTANAILDHLASTPDGIIVSEETAHDYSIVAGDHINIRLQQPSDGTFLTLRFQLVGVAREFPTAPQDSFLVVNRDYLSTQLKTDIVSTFLIRASGDPAQVARDITQKFAGKLRLKVETIDAVAAHLASTLTTISLEGLTKIEWLYTLLIAGLGLGIFLLGLLAERETEYATLVALGAAPGQVRAFIIAEALFAALSGMVIGGVVGLVVTQVLVVVLGAVFDPPPTQMLIYVDTLVILFSLIGASLVFSTALASLQLRRLQAATALRNG